MKRNVETSRMTIEAGDKYLELLSSFVQGNTEKLVEGTVVLKLNPVGLHYVQSRLEALEELETLRIRAPVDYLRAYVADLGDHRALEQLRRVLRILSSVKVGAIAAAHPCRNPTTITLLPFSRLRSLELRNCDLSTTAPRGLLELRPILERLVCYNSAEALRHIFAERTKEIKGAPVWTRLSDVSCFGNKMRFTDESLQLLPALEALDLGRNRFDMVTNLEKCPNLKFLDVGFNCITTVASLNQMLRGIVKLVLRNNALDSTRGLHNLTALEALDLSHNLISNFYEVEVLGQLPSLRLLWLQGNPITLRLLYRREALSHFQVPTQLVLDGKKTSRLENCAAKRLAAWRVKRVGKYGAFVRAEAQISTDSSLQSLESEERSSFPFSLRESASTSAGRGKAKRRSSRLASILDFSEVSHAIRSVDAILPLPLSTVVSLDSSLTESQQVESKKETEEIIHNLMERAEVLKRTGSSTWLKDLNSLLDSDGLGKSEIQEKIASLDKIVHQTESLQKKKRNKLGRKSTAEELSEIARDSRDAGNPNVGDDEAETSHGRVSRNSSGRFSRATSARLSRESSNLSRDSGAGISRENSIGTSQESSAKLGHKEKALVHDTNLEESDRSFGHGSSPRSLDDPAVGLSKPIASYVNDGDEPRLPSQSGAFKLSEKLVTGSLSHTSSTASPPQFHQDLLHRRHTLERERLQLPPEVDVLSADVSDFSSDSMSSELVYSSDDATDRGTSSGWSLSGFDQDESNNFASEPRPEVDNRDIEDSSEKRIVNMVDSPDGTSQIAATEDESSGHGGQNSMLTLPSAGSVGVVNEDLTMRGGTDDQSTIASNDMAYAQSQMARRDSGGGAVVNLPTGATERVLRDVAQLPTTTGHLERDSGSAQSSADQESSSASRQEHGAGSMKYDGLSHPKSKSSRRIVNLDSSSGDCASSVPIRGLSLTRRNDPSNMRRHSTSSFVMRGAAGQMLPRSLSSVQYSQPLTIGRSSSMDQDSESQRDWPRSRSQEEAFPSTSLQTVESH